MPAQRRSIATVNGTGKIPRPNSRTRALHPCAKNGLAVAMKLADTLQKKQVYCQLVVSIAPLWLNIAQEMKLWSFIRMYRPP